MLQSQNFIPFNSAAVKVGIAGYMGAGKSLATALLKERFGCCTLYADEVAKEIMVTNPQIIKELEDAFGDSILESGSLVYKKLGDIVFSSMDDLLTLNKIVHPVLLKVLKQKFDNCSAPINVLDAALIPFWKIESWFDACIWVESSSECRQNRLLQKFDNQDVLSLRQRIDIQEKLFSPPCGHGWEIIFNENGRDRFREELYSLVEDISLKRA